MRKILKGFVSIITAPFRWISKAVMFLINKTFLSEFLAEDPEETPILDTIQKATEKPKDFLESLLEHLSSLRKHLFRSIFALIIASALAFMYIEEIMAWLAQPIGGIGELQAIEVTEPVGVVMRITFLTGFAVSLPYISLEILRFIAPGISRKSRLLGLIGIPFVVFFFAGGLAFSYFVMLKPALDVLTNFMNIQTILRPASYFKFVTGLMFWIGIAFEFPLISFILSAMRILPARLLKDQWRLAFIILTILAAMITPTIDPINMMLVLLPLWSLYGLSIMMAYIAQQGGDKDQEAE